MNPLGRRAERLTPGCPARLPKNPQPLLPPMNKHTPKGRLLEAALVMLGIAIVLVFVSMAKAALVSPF